MSAERETLRGAIASAVCNARVYPEGVAHTILGRDMSSVIDATLEAVLATGLVKVQEPEAELPFRVGDVVREVGEEELTGEIINVSKNPNGDAYRVKLYKPVAGMLSIIYYEDEIELIERPGK